MLKREYSTSVLREVELDDLCRQPAFSELSKEIQWALRLFTDDTRYPYFSGEVKVDVIVYPGSCGRFNGPPEDCYPAEPAYAEVDIPSPRSYNFLNTFLIPIEKATRSLMEGCDNATLIVMFGTMLDEVAEYVADNWEELLEAEIYDEDNWR